MQISQSELWDLCLSEGTSVCCFNPFPLVGTEIPAYTQKLNINFLCQTRGIIVQISQSEL